MFGPISSEFSSSSQNTSWRNPRLVLWWRGKYRIAWLYPFSTPLMQAVLSSIARNTTGRLRIKENNACNAMPSTLMHSDSETVSDSEVEIDVAGCLLVCQCKGRPRPLAPTSSMKRPLVLLVETSLSQARSASGHAQISTTGKSSVDNEP